MKYAVTIVILIACCVTVYAQSSITKIDFVKIKEGKKTESLYFYENNWKVYRDIALHKLSLIHIFPRDYIFHTNVVIYIVQL